LSLLKRGVIISNTGFERREATRKKEQAWIPGVVRGKGARGAIWPYPQNGRGQPLLSKRTRTNLQQILIYVFIFAFL